MSLHIFVEECLRFFHCSLGLLSIVAERITMCEGSTVEAEHQGFILSPRYTDASALNCTLTLTNIPPHSWFELKLTSANWYDNCDQEDSRENYNSIRILEAEVILCKSRNVTRLYFDSDQENITIEFRSTWFNTTHRFRLRYRGMYICGKFIAPSWTTLEL